MDIAGFSFCHDICSTSISYCQCSATNGKIKLLTFIKSVESFKYWIKNDNFASSVETVFAIHLKNVEQSQAAEFCSFLCLFLLNILCSKSQLFMSQFVSLKLIFCLCASLT